VAGLERLLQVMPVGAWVDPVVPNTNQSYARSLELVIEKNITPIRASRGVTLDMGPTVTVEILWPMEPFLLDGDEPSHNDNSIVVKITHGDVSFLVPGDIESEAERRLVELDGDGLQSDVLVLAHHGSRTSSTAEFLDAVSPSVAMIPVGLDNSYGHPHDEVLQRLRFRDIDVYRTDLDGTIEVVSDGESYQVTTRGPQLSGSTVEKEDPA
jgi:beta-lactamase superfamily II metal-dependent hydrolase